MDPAAFPAPTEEPTEVPTVAPTAVPVGWCTGLASQLQESLTAAVGRRHPDAESLEAAFRQLLVTFREVQPGAPAELEITMESAIESLEDLVRLLEEFDWELPDTDAGRLNRVDGRFEGTLWALDEYTVDECDLPSGVLLPSDLTPTRVSWCDGTAAEVQLALYQAITISTEDPFTYEEVYRQLSTTLDEIQPMVPVELEVSMAVTVDNLRSFIRELDDYGWDLGDMTQPVRLSVKYDIQETLGRIEEHLLVECDVESTLVLPVLPPEGPFGVADDEPSVLDTDEPATDEPDTNGPILPASRNALRSDIVSWELVARIPQSGIRNRLTALAPFPTSHVASTRRIDALEMTYDISPESPDLLVRLTYLSDLPIDDAVSFITDAMLDEEGEVEIDDATEGFLELRTEPLEFPTSVHTVRFYSVGPEETEIVATFSIEDLAPNVEDRVQELAARWHRDTWPEAPSDGLQIAIGTYEWSIELGPSVRAASDYLIDDTTHLRFDDELLRSDLAWSSEVIGDDARLLVTADYEDCLLLAPNRATYVSLYGEAVYTDGC